jgi:hypothetical protein
LVDAEKAAGSDFIKVYNGIPRDAYFALAKRANEIGIPFAGHIPRLIKVAEASDAGQCCIEHVYGVLLGCSTEETRLIEQAGERAKAKAIGDSVISRTVYLREKDRLTLATQDETITRQLLEQFARNETWQVPTLVTMRGMAFQSEITTEDLYSDQRLRYFKIPDYWLPQNDPFAENNTDEDWEIIQAVYERILELLPLMQQMGVPLMAGTDTPNPGAFPGFGIHDELQLMVEAGLTSLQALQAATTNAARFQAADDSLGQIAPGMIADLVLLEENPLSDIRNTSQIRSVVLDGTLLDRVTLDSILVELTSQVSQPARDSL